MLAGAAIIFFAYIGFDSVSTHAEEAKNPQRDVPIGIIASLVLCTLLYVGVVAVLTGMVSYDRINTDAGVAAAWCPSRSLPAYTRLTRRPGSARSSLAFSSLCWQASCRSMRSCTLRTSV